VWQRLWHRFAEVERDAFLEARASSPVSSPRFFPGAGHRGGDEQIGADRAGGDRHVAAGLCGVRATGRTAAVRRRHADLDRAADQRRGQPALRDLQRALQPHFSYLPLWRRTVLGFFNGDLHFVYFMQRYTEPGYAPGKEGYFWGMALFNCVTWQVSSIIGILLASLFPDSWGWRWPA
jgi:hypothetical protein